MSEFVALFALLGIIWFWQENLRVREIAIDLAKEFCARENVQFLDGAIGSVSLGLKRDRQGRLVIARNYQFEFTDTGDNRLKGTIMMLGHKLEAMHLPPYGAL